MPSANLPLKRSPTLLATLGASRLILGTRRRNALVNILRGNLVREVSDLLPEEIDLLVYA